MVDDLKARSSEILVDEKRKFFREKVTFYKFSKESENFSKTGGKSETEGKCIMVSGGMDAPGSSRNFDHIRSVSIISQIIEFIQSTIYNKIHYIG